MDEEKGFCERRSKIWIVVCIVILIATVIWSFHGKGRMARAGRGWSMEGIRISGYQGIRGSGDQAPSIRQPVSNIQNPAPDNITTAPHQYKGPCNQCHTNATANSIRMDSTVISLKSVNAGNRMTLATAHHSYWGKCSNCHKNIWETCHTCHKNGQARNTPPKSPVSGIRNPASGTRALIDFGADLLNVDSVIARVFNILPSNGLLVDMVFKGSPADRSGLMRRDVILAIDGQGISNLSQFIDMLWNFDEGDKIQLSILRNGKVRDIKFQL